MLFVFWLMLTVLCIGWTATAANNKGHDPVVWGFAAVFGGPFTLIAVAAQPDLKQRRILRLMAEHQGVDFSNNRKPKQQKPCDLYPELAEVEQ